MWRSNIAPVYHIKRMIAMDDMVRGIADDFNIEGFQ
jgi:hypothetical protein